MATLLPEAPSFGTAFARALGGGASKGVSDSIEMQNKLALEKGKFQQILDLAKGSTYKPSEEKSDSSPELQSKFLDALPQIEQSLGRKLQPKEVETMWEKLQGNSQNSQSGQNNSDEGQNLALDILAPEVGRGVRERSKMKRKEFESERAFHSGRSEKILAKADEERESLRKQENSLQLMEDAIQNMEGGLSSDYLAEITGYEPFRTAKGAQFKTASKEFLLSNLSRAGARPNMWIEQQIGDMAAKIGRSREANETFTAAKRADIEIEKKRLDLLGSLEDQYMKTLGYVPKTISREVDKAIKPYADQVQDKLAYDLREIYERESGTKKLSRLEKVPTGTPLTLEKAMALADVSPGKNSVEREENSLKIAKKLGYKIMSDEFYRSVL